MAKIGFTVDSLHLLEQLHAEADHPGIKFGIAIIHSVLQHVAKRAIQLNDKKMLGYMMTLHLVDEIKVKGHGRQ